MKKSIRSLTVVCSILLIITVSREAFAETASNDGDWQFNLTPLYVWVVGIEGHGEVSNSSLSSSHEYEDVFELSAAYLGHFEAMHKSNWGLLIDTNYIGLSGGQDFSIGALNIDFEATVAELSGVYRIVGQNYQFDIIAGIRYMNLGVDVSLTGTPTGEINLNQNWIDPLIGARCGWQIAENWKLMIRGDIGGFGVGSDFAWQAAGLVDWQPFEYVSFIAGYRALYENYQSDSDLEVLSLDATFHGPVVGVNLRW